MKEISEWWLWLLGFVVTIAALTAGVCLTTVEIAKPFTLGSRAFICFGAGLISFLVCLVGTIARLKNREQAYDQLAERIRQLIPPTTKGEPASVDLEANLAWIRSTVTNNKKVTD